MSALAQWIAYQRRAAVFGTSEETVLALLDVAEKTGALLDEWEEVSAEEEAHLPRAFVLKMRALDAALARLDEVGQ